MQHMIPQPITTPITPINDKQLKMILCINDALNPVAACEQFPWPCPAFKFVNATPNNFINPIIFETSDAFKGLVKDLCIEIFNTSIMADVVQFNKDGTFMFVG